MLIFKWGKCCYWFQYCKKRKGKKKKTAAVLGFPDTVLSRVCDGQQFVGGKKKTHQLVTEICQRRDGQNHLS